MKVDFDIENPPERIYVTYGPIVKNVIAAKTVLAQNGIEAGIVLVEKIKPYAPVVEFLRRITCSNTKIVYVEEGIRNGGAAMITRDILIGSGKAVCERFDIAAIDDNFAVPEEICDLYDYAGISPDKIAKYFLN